MGEPITVIIPLTEDKNLCFVFQPAEGCCVNDAVSILLKGCAVDILVLRVDPASRIPTFLGIW